MSTTTRKFTRGDLMQMPPEARKKLYKEVNREYLAMGELRRLLCHICVGDDAVASAQKDLDAVKAKYASTAAGNI